MSYNQNSGIRQFVPDYVVKSDYLPSRVQEGSDPNTNQWLRQYEENKRLGKVMSTAPANFDPARYKSIKIMEAVHINQPVSEVPRHFIRK